MYDFPSLIIDAKYTSTYTTNRSLHISLYAILLLWWKNINKNQQCNKNTFVHKIAKFM